MGSASSIKTQQPPLSTTVASMDSKEQESLQRELLTLSFPKFAPFTRHRSFGGSYLSDGPSFSPAANWRSAKAKEEEKIKELAPLSPKREAATLEQKVPKEALEDEPREKKKRGATVFDG